MFGRCAAGSVLTVDAMTNFTTLVTPNSNLALLLVSKFTAAAEFSLTTSSGWIGFGLDQSSMAFCDGPCYAVMLVCLQVHAGAQRLLTYWHIFLVEVSELGCWKARELYRF